MISDTQRFFLRCLTDYLHHTETQDAPDIDWDELFSFAQDQSLDAIVFHQCNKFLPIEVRKHWLHSYLSHTVISIQRKEAFDQLINLTRKLSIPILCMKGSVFRDLYSVPALRSMGDIDFVIHKRDRDAVDHILREEMGYLRFIDNHEVWTYWKDKLYFEVHTKMFYEYLANDFDYQQYFDNVWEHCYRTAVFDTRSENLFVPEEGFHLLYLMTHTAKHITNHGSGLRPFLDMVLLVKHHESQLDWEWIEKELLRLQLLTFTQRCFSLCERWFSVQMPLASPVLEEQFYEEATHKVFADGIFGLQNPENTGAHSAKELKRSNTSRIQTLIRLTWQKMFPPYEDMQLIPWYSFVDGKPWLMPYAWVYRWFYCLKHKKKAGTDLLAEPFVKKELIAAREEWLNQWGL